MTWAAFTFPRDVRNRFDYLRRMFQSQNLCDDRLLPRRPQPLLNPDFPISIPLRCAAIDRDHFRGLSPSYLQSNHPER